MRPSNTYIILYSAAITVVCGGLLAFASVSLKDKQDANIAMEKKQNILSSVVTLNEGDDINALYESQVKRFVLDYAGNVKEGMAPDQVDLAKEHKKAPAERLLPVYEFRNQADPTKIEYAVMPVYGYGIWNNISGFVAVKSDFSTIQGVKFQHVGETPGLGGECENPVWCAQWKGKSILDEQKKLVGVVVKKGRGDAAIPAEKAHKVDGLWGAPITSNGITNFVKKDLVSFDLYLAALRSKHN